MSVSWLLKDKVSYTIHTGIHSLKYLFGYVVYGLMFYFYFVLMSTFKTNRNELCERCKQHNYTLCSYMTFQYKQKVNKKVTTFIFNYRPNEINNAGFHWHWGKK